MESYTDALAVEAWSVMQQVEAQGGMLAAAESGWVAAQMRPTEAAREKDIAVRKARIVGISEHADVMEERHAQEQPDYQALATAAAQRLANWRYQHAGVAVRALPGGDGLTAAAMAAAAAGATLGQIAKVINQGEPARAAPLLVHPYDAAFEELRDASDAFAVKHGHRPMVYLAGIGSIAEQVARKVYAADFFAVGGFDVVANEVRLDVAGSVAGFVASKAKIAVICSTNKHYATAVTELAPQLKAAGAHTVLVAGSPGPAEAAWRAAGVDQFIYVRRDVVATLWPILHAEEAQT